MEKFTANPKELEQVLVQQFRILQELIALSQKERLALLKEPDQILPIVEDKEALIDKMSLMEDKCRQVVQELSVALGIRAENTSIQALLPYFRPEDASTIKNLADGIYSLANQARELNRASHALAVTKLDWVKATQLFLISIFQPDSGYPTPKDSPKFQEPTTGLGLEVHA